MPAAASRHAPGEISHNLLGQRLGRKGRGTRERILAATEELLAAPADTPVTMSAVARAVPLGLPTLYLYFGDLTELLLAVLDPIMASSRQSYGEHLAEFWPDEALAEHCLRFVRAYHAFWERHARVLHLRNTLADGRDERMAAHRIAVSRPLIELLLRQMRADGDVEARDMASVLLTGTERVVTITTDEFIVGMSVGEIVPDVDGRLRMQARLLEFGIRDRRTIAAG